MIYPHSQWTATMRKSPGVWFTLLNAEKSQDGAMRVMAFRIRQGEIVEYRPAGTFDAMYRDGVLWAMCVDPAAGRPAVEGDRRRLRKTMKGDT